MAPSVLDEAGATYERWMSAVRSKSGGGVDAAASKKHRFDGFVALGCILKGTRSTTR